MKKAWDNPRENSMPAEARVPAEVVIGGVRVAPATVLAPMAGVTDTVFRRFIRNASVFTADGPGDGGEAALDSVGLVDAPISNQQSGCGLIMTEFTSADGLSRMRESKRKRYLSYYEDEHPISAQLFGSDPHTLSEAAKIVEDAGFDMVDLNLGCPAKRVVSCNGGSGLLRDLPLIATIFERVRAAVQIPFTVKFRMGWNDRQIVCVELARAAQESGLNAVALHARTREQGYSGQARWEYIAAVKDAVRIPVIGNGDIRSPEDACTMVAETGCDAVMIGRAAPANPWIFRQIAQYTVLGRYEQPTEMDRYRMIRTYFLMLIEEGGSNAEAAGKMKQFASWFTHGVHGGAVLRKRIYEAKSGADVLSAVDAFFANRMESESATVFEQEALLR
ncbi:MAG TPA: tRNA dihydrouridine synthase DusB [Acidobacteriaceae bacterium]|nr:tRNA dihydrouridine synthase DusB [Acidobacteriaceae bacterium]